MSHTATPTESHPQKVTERTALPTLVVGAGPIGLAAAAHLLERGLDPLVALATLAESKPKTTAVWVLRRGVVGDVYGGGDADQLPARGALGNRARDAAGQIEIITGFRTDAVEYADDPDSGPRQGEATLTLVSEDGRRISGIDEVVGLTGFRPDHRVTSELRLNLDTRLEAPVKLAPLIDPNVRSCGTVYPPWRRCSQPRRTGRLPGRDEELRASPHLPSHDRLRTGPLRRRRAGRRPPSRQPCRADPPGDRRLRWLRTLRRRRRRGTDHQRRMLHAHAHPPPDRRARRQRVLLRRRPDTPDLTTSRRRVATLDAQAAEPISGPRPAAALPALCITQITCWGILYYAFPVLAPSIAADTGWSTTTITAGFSLGLIVSALAGIPVGRILDNRGPAW